MRLSEWIGLMEEIAPPALAMDYDNVGLLIGTNREINTVLVALDLSVSVAKEAIEKGADLVLTHHPLFFHPVSRILPDDPETASAYILIQNGIGMYAAHTNLDACQGGVNDAICDLLELEQTAPLREDGIGRIGFLKKPVSFSAFISLCCKIFDTDVSYQGEEGQIVRKIGIIGGAGGDMVSDAVKSGCDVFLTGEMKHHEAVTASYYEIPYIAAGHYQTEVPVLKKMISRLQTYGNGVKYIESSIEKAPLKTH